VGLKEIYNSARDNNDPQQCGQVHGIVKFYLDIASATWTLHNKRGNLPGVCRNRPAINGAGRQHHFRSIRWNHVSPSSPLFGLRSENSAAGLSSQLKNLRRTEKGWKDHPHRNGWL